MPTEISNPAALRLRHIAVMEIGLRNGGEGGPGLFYSYTFLSEQGLTLGKTDSNVASERSKQLAEALFASLERDTLEALMLEPLDYPDGDGGAESEDEGIQY